MIIVDNFTRFPAFVFDNTKDKNESVLDNKATVQVVRGWDNFDDDHCKLYLSKLTGPGQNSEKNFSGLEFKESVLGKNSNWAQKAPRDIIQKAKTTYLARINLD